MIRCSTCVIPDSRPDTEFVDGQCSACIAYAKRPEIDWDARTSELVALLDRHHGRCIVPSSGGKDSTYQAITLKNMGADVTAVTATTCHLTEMGRKNIDNLARHVRTIEVTPNMTERARLNRLGLETVGDISWPEHTSIFTTPFRMAVALNTPLIFYGENPQNQYGGPLDTQEARLMTRRWTQEFGGFLGLRASDVSQMGYDMRGYELPTDAGMQRIGVEAHFLGQYIPWDSHINALVASDYGFKFVLPTLANWWPWENQDNAQTGVHDYMMFLKYGYGRGAAQISVDIRTGLITREDALDWVEMYDGVFTENYMGIKTDSILDRIGMTRIEFDIIAHKFTNKKFSEETSIVKKITT